MILLSVCKNKGYLTWIVMGEGIVQERETLKVDSSNGYESTKTLGESMFRALKSLNSYVESINSTMPDDEFVRIETSSSKIYDWFVDVDIKEKYKGFVLPLIDELQKLPLQVEVVIQKNQLMLVSNRYNSEDFVTKNEEKVFRAIDIF